MQCHDHQSEQVLGGGEDTNDARDQNRTTHESQLETKIFMITLGDLRQSEMSSHSHDESAVQVIL
jgi:hypothetical protein